MSACTCEIDRLRRLVTAIGPCEPAWDMAKEAADLELRHLNEASSS